MRKQKLNPVKVPWKISASDEIALFQCENDRLEILLIADLFDSAKLDKQGTGSDFFDYVSIVQLRLVFETVLYFEYSRPQQTAFGLDPKKYDVVINPSSHDRSAFFLEGPQPDPVCGCEKAYRFVSRPEGCGGVCRAAGGV